MGINLMRKQITSFVCFVDDKSRLKGLTFERSTGLRCIVSTEEEAARLKAGARRRRLIFYPELSQFCHFLTRNKKQWHWYKEINVVIFIYFTGLNMVHC